ncbi:MAG: CPBP family intramembrane metalloprotease [Deltaproteobacteria bacterium]|nr:CPBP family intramembrane metalloprotease [Deltaproteobacteria bacterium]
MSSQAPGPPFPTPGLAFGLAGLAAFAMLALTAGFGGGTAAFAFASVAALGGLGTLAARYVPEPAPLRLGLTALSLSALPLVLLLLPVVLLTSEADNWIRIALDAKQSAELGKPKALPVEEILTAVLLLPIVREFFLRGVLLQGCVSALGRARGIALIAFLQALLFSPGDPAQPAMLASAAAQGLVLGGLLGALRLATGSILPCIALEAGTTAIGVAATVYPHLAPIPGFNAPGDTTPLSVLAPAALSVAAGIWLLAQQLEREPELPPIPPPAPEDDEEPGSLF